MMLTIIPAVMTPAPIREYADLVGIVEEEAKLLA